MGKDYSLDFSKSDIAEDRDRQCISFDAKNQDGQRVLCRISHEALQYNFNDPHGDPLEIFKANRPSIENIANELYSKGVVLSNGTILITNKYFVDKTTDLYTKTWNWLVRYDEGGLNLPKNLFESNDSKFFAEEDKSKLFKQARDAIESLRAHQKRHNEVVDLFGVEKDPRELEGILLNLNQSFGGEEFYPSVEEKAAHLLYFIIKDHPFIDGNKRIACRLFLLFLQKARKDHLVNDRTLTAIAALIAESAPSEKDSLVKLVVNLVADDSEAQ